MTENRPRQWVCLDGFEKTYIDLSLLLEVIEPKDGNTLMGWRDGMAACLRMGGCSRPYDVWITLKGWQQLRRWIFDVWNQEGTIEL